MLGLVAISSYLLLLFCGKQHPDRKIKDRRAPQKKQNNKPETQPATRCTLS
jgi:hypothetical protein